MVVYSEECAYECEDFSEGDEYGGVDLALRRGEECADEQGASECCKEYGAGELHCHLVGLFFDFAILSNFNTMIFCRLKEKLLFVRNAYPLPKVNSIENSAKEWHSFL